uniref:hypothetical protein n=1 Tax=Dialister sp. TaxID=1955814 RepID=UPI0040262810
MLPQASLVKRAVRRLWDYRFEAYTFQKVTHPDTHITETKLAVIEGGPWPCRISRKNAVPATGGNVSPSTVQQEIKLLCGEELDIPAGASIRVWKDGEEKALRFKAAGVPFKYDNHQEIELIQEEDHP